MSAARPPEGAHTAAKGEGIPVIAARPPEGAHTAAGGEGIPVIAARPPEGAHTAAGGEGIPVIAARPPEGTPVGASAMAPLRATLRGLLGRAGHVLIVLALLSVATFSMLELLPGSVVDAMLSDNARPEEIARLQHALGLDLPMHLRFLGWLGNALQGDLGRSPLSGESVSGAIAHRLPVSILLMLLAQVLALLIALPLGIWAGGNAGRRVDRWLSGGAFGVLAVPHFVLGLLLILLFAIWLRWFPATGYVPFGAEPLASIHSLALPAATLALVEAPIYLRLLRSDIASTLRAQYITVARAKGLSERQILLRHALRPSSFSLITVLGINVGHLIGGAVIIETLFALPGLGRLLIEAITQRDFVTLQGLVLFIGVAFVAVNLVVDAVYALLDPRVGVRHAR
ncbi:ABC transporter permease [Verminephrobacter eiseniae]|uniref:ABC transporter permease n=1 Tax=Verminephrobacter eiseniae TaxID=364317 RepID=UPI0022388DAB|nr:ABC transporter permease subunit [Verminephrobacter eiseniae]